MDKTILIVDDEKHILERVTNTVGIFGKILYATSTEEAVKTIAHNKIDLVITDINLPGRDGLFFIKEAWRISSKTKVIIISGTKKTKEELQKEISFEDFNIVEFIPKPIDLKLLGEIVEKILG